jgi:hypothetical protein
MRYNDDGTGTALPGAVAVYATTSAGDNAGLFAYGVDMHGAALDFLDNYGQGVRFNDSTIPRQPTKHVGFLTGYTTSVANATVTGVQDLGQTTPPNPNTVPPTPGLWGNMIPVFGLGQEAGDMNSLKPAGYDATTQQINGQGTAYGATSGTGWTNGYLLAVGTVPTVGTPQGAIDIRNLKFTTTSVDHKASVWVARGPSGSLDPVLPNTEAAVLVSYEDLIGGTALPIFGLNGEVQGQNQAVGGSIAVTGSNGSYVSEVDQLIANVAEGNAPIATIGDEAGSVYVMARLLGDQAAIDAALGQLDSDVGPGDSQYAALHAAYDSQFGPGGFNALFKFANTPGAKTVNFDFGTTGVTVDALAAVPEPGMISLLGLGALGLVARRRRMA